MTTSTRPPATNAAAERSRGQAHTLEGIVAGLIVLSSIAFALQVTAVTPLSASTSSQHIQNQQRAAAAGVLATAADADSLEATVLHWNESGARFHGGTVRGGYASAPPTEFGDLLSETFDRRGIAYNVHLTFSTTDGRQRRVQLVRQGVPSDNAVRATRQVTLTDDDRLRAADGTRTARTVSAADSFYAPDVGDSSFYNVVRVEVVVWRI